MLGQRLQAVWRIVSTQGLRGSLAYGLYQLPIPWRAKRLISHFAYAVAVGVFFEVLYRLVAFLARRDPVLNGWVFAIVFSGVLADRLWQSYRSRRVKSPPRRRRRPQKGTPIEPPGKTLFASIAPGLQLRRGVERDTHQEIDWIPVVPLVSDGEGLVGLDADGYWVVEGPYGLHVIDRAEVYLFLFRMMERPMQDIVAEISENPAFEGCADRIVAAFPFVDIIRTAFRVAGFHWIECAFGWFEELPTAARALLSDELEALCAGRSGGGRRFRHRAQTELARIRRESGQ